MRRPDGHQFAGAWPASLGWLGVARRRKFVLKAAPPPPAGRSQRSGKQGSQALALPFRSAASRRSQLMALMLYISNRRRLMMAVYSPLKRIISWTLRALIGDYSQEGEVKTSTIIALALATALSGSLAAYAQTEQPTIHHHSSRSSPLHHHLWRTAQPRRSIARRPCRAGRESRLLSPTRCSGPMLIPETATTTD